MPNTQWMDINFFFICIFQGIQEPSLFEWKRIIVLHRSVIDVEMFKMSNIIDKYILMYYMNKMLVCRVDYLMLCTYMRVL